MNPQYTDKDSRVPEYAELYQVHDYITAYSLHTDMRIARDGPELAIGANGIAGQGWTEHGRQQLEFLKSLGLKPHHKLLDFGCGTGRLACQAVPYLDTGNYTGVDISSSAIECAQSREWGKKEPVFILGDGSFPEGDYHLIWAHSVFTHLPDTIVADLFAQLTHKAFGAFVFTYKQNETYRRSGLKQYQFPLSYFQGMAKLHGLIASDMNITWPAGQRTVRVYRA